jgi:hypothetical protein
VIAGPAEELAPGVHPLNDVLESYKSLCEARWTFQVSQIPSVDFWKVDRFVQIDSLQVRPHGEHAACNPSVPQSAEQATDRELFQDALARIGPHDGRRHLSNRSGCCGDPQHHSLQCRSSAAMIAAFHAHRP